MARNSIIGWIVKKLKGNMALVEESTTASQNISANKYVVFQGVLCTADAAISQGDTLATSGAGKNLTEVTGGGFNELNDHIATKEPLILHETKTMTSSSDSIRLDTVGIDGSKVLNAVVTNTNNIGCLLYKYSTYWYLAFINLSTMARASGQYDVLISYRAS